MTTNPRNQSNDHRASADSVSAFVRRLHPMALTPLGPVTSAGLAALRAFGKQAERLECPCMGSGGFVIPGRDPAGTHLPGNADR